MLFLVVLGWASAEEPPTPVEHAVTLLTGLQTEVQIEGAAEKQQYNQFACFCKQKQLALNRRITRTKAQIAQLEADVKADRAEAAKQERRMRELELEGDRLQGELKDQLDQREIERAQHVRDNEDAAQARASVKAAIEAIEAGCPDDGCKDAEVLIQGKAVALDHARALAAGDFHSGDLLGTLEQLKQKFIGRQKTLKDAEEATQNAFKQSSTAKESERTATMSLLTVATGAKTAAENQLAQDTEDLDEANVLLADDTQYLRTLTQECEAKAKTWDQRSSLRATELEAIEQALELLSGKVAEQSTKMVHKDVAGAKLLFLQEQAVVSPRAHRRLQLKAAKTDARAKALAFLEHKRDELGASSASLLAAAAHLQSDPMAKVKTMIQQLIERLVTALKDEAEHKGWCDTEMGTAESTRDSRYTRTVEINTQVEAAEARESELESNIGQLKSEIMVLDSTLVTAQQARNEEKVENKRIIKEARAGADAIREVISLLEDFYRPAARAKVLLQEEQPANIAAHSGDALQDIKDSVGGAGFGQSGDGGAYQGAQASAHGVLGALAVVKADFDRTVESTTAAEYQSARDFQAFEQLTMAAKAERARGLEQSKKELDETRADLAVGLEDLKSTQDLLDKVLESLEVLRPGCEYNGMGYEEGKARKEAEISALKTAVCLIDGEDEGC